MRTKAQAMTTINCEPRELCDLFGHPEEGHHERCKRRQILELVVTIIGPVQRLGRQEARRSGPRRGDIDELSAPVANRSVAADNDSEKDEDGPDA